MSRTKVRMEPIDMDELVDELALKCEELKEELRKAHAKIDRLELDYAMRKMGAEKLMRHRMGGNRDVRA